MITGDGIHLNVSREEYDENARDNYSTLRLIKRSPAHYRWAKMLRARPADRRADRERFGTDQMRFGRCGHLATYEPDEFARRCTVWDGGTRRGGAWEEFKAKLAGDEYLNGEDEYAHCLAIQNAVRNDRHAGPLCSGGSFEVTVLWTYVSKAIGALDEWKSPLKGRIDFRNALGLSDLKTCRDGSPEKFGRSADDLTYWVQAAMYTDAVAAITGAVEPYHFIAVETEDPYVVQVYELLPHQLEKGRDVYRSWLAQAHACKQTSSYHGYAQGPMPLQLPRWSLAAEDPSDVSGLGLDFTDDDDQQEGAAP